MDNINELKEKQKRIDSLYRLIDKRKKRHSYVIQKLNKGMDPYKKREIYEKSVINRMIDLENMSYADDIYKYQCALIELSFPSESDKEDIKRRYKKIYKKKKDD